LRLSQARRNLPNVQSARHVRSVLMLLLLLAGTGAFLVDVINPLTPTPLIWPRVVVLCFLILEAIRSLAILFDFKMDVIATGISVPASANERWCDTLALICTRLR
jgi:hypothetical protein